MSALHHPDFVNSHSAPLVSKSPWLDFLWIELTSKCNLRCGHCYSDSSPLAGEDDVLAKSDYENLIREAHDIGCRRLQFIGGEPTLNRDLASYISLSRRLGFEFIEVFSNLTRDASSFASLSAEHGINVATSVYSHDPVVHDKITGVEGSHRRTMSGIECLVSQGIDVRVGVIVGDDNADHVTQTMTFLKNAGVSRIGVDRVRKFGRAAPSDGLCGGDENELCGQCWRGRLCIAPNGNASPCIMSRQWPVGNILTSSLTEILNGRDLLEARSAVYRSTRSGADRGIDAVMCNPSPCSPDWHCSPDGSTYPCVPRDDCVPNR